LETFVCLRAQNFFMVTFCIFNKIFWLLLRAHTIPVVPFFMSGLSHGRLKQVAAAYFGAHIHTGFQLPMALKLQDS